MFDQLRVSLGNSVWSFHGRRTESCQVLLLGHVHAVDERLNMEPLYLLVARAPLRFAESMRFLAINRFRADLTHNATSNYDVPLELYEALKEQVET